VQSILSAICIYAIGFGLCHLALAEEKKSDNIESKRIFVKPFISIPVLTLELEPRETDSESDDNGSVEYEPNIRPDLGLSAKYDSITVSFSAPLPVDEDDQKEKGKTSYKDIKLDYYKEIWGADIGMQNYEGFYRDDDELEDDDSEDKVYEQRSDLKKTGRFLSAYYLPFGKSPDFGRSFLSGIIQRKINWSPVVQLSYDYSEIKSNGPLVPKDKFSLYGDDALFTGGRFETYTLSAGASGNFLMRRNTNFWGMLLFGRSAQYRFIQTSEGSKNGWQNPNSFSLRLAADYLHGIWIYGLQFSINETELKLIDTTLNSTVGTVVVSAGTHLDEFYH